MYSRFLMSDKDIQITENEKTVVSIQYPYS